MQRESLSIQKTELRKRSSKIRSKVPKERREKAVQALVEMVEWLSGAHQKILSFVSFGSEIDLAPLNRKLAEQKRLLLPKVDGNRLLVYRIDNPKHFSSTPYFHTFDSSARTSLKCGIGPRQSPEIEIVGEGGSIEEIQPPSPTTQSRELSRRSNPAFEACSSTRADRRCVFVGLGEADLILVPGLLFDRDYFRLGYGYGYYDRFLAALPRPIPSIGVGFHEQLSQEPLPREPWDVPLKQLLLV